MTSRETILLVDDDRRVTEGLSMLLERPGRTTIVCSDIESAELMLARREITHVISDVHFVGQFAFEGLHFLGRVRSRTPRCRMVLMSGNLTPALRAEAKRLGADAVLGKPFAIEELENALASQCVDAAGGDYEVARVAPIDEILSGDALTIAFQPIVRIGNGESESFAFEALARVHGDWPADIGALFDYAARRGRLRELNLLALMRAIESAKELPPGANVFINVDPSAFTSDLPDLIADTAKRAGVATDRLVLEITERSHFAEPLKAEPIFRRLHEQGIRFALDDHGSAYSHLAIIDLLQPSFVKISNAFGTGLEDDATNQRIVAHVAWLAREFGCQTVLEGIESAESARAAEALGIELAQGFHFGRPGAAGSWRDE